MLRLAMVFVMISSGAYADMCSYLPPLKPFGCNGEKRICMCNADGDKCEWVWICEK